MFIVVCMKSVGDEEERKKGKQKTAGSSINVGCLGSFSAEGALVVSE